MRIAFVSQWFDPEGGSAAIPGAMARALKARGHEVSVVTGFPNYPHGRLYDGYRIRPVQRETIRGIPVTRVALYPSHDRSGVWRALNFLSFMLSASTLGAWTARRSQVALIYSTPATVGMVGIVLRRLLRRPFVLYIQDLWPDTVTASGMMPARVAGPADRVLTRFCALVYRSAARIAVISPGMKDRLVERGVPEDRVEVIYNWVDEDLFRSVPPDLNRDRFEVMYAGNLGDVQGLETAIEAMALLADLPHVHLRFIGDGVARERLEALARERRVADRVHFEGARSVDEMADVMASAHVQLVCLSDAPLFHVTMPSKIQAILACGRPLICSAPGDAARLARDSGAGVVVAPGDPASLAAGIRRTVLMTDDEREAHGRAGRRFYETNLAAAIGAERLDRALERALHDDRRSRV